MKLFTQEEVIVLSQNILSVTKLTSKVVVVRCDTKAQAKNVYYILKANYPQVGTYILSLDAFVGYGKLTEYIFKTEEEASEVLLALQNAIGQQSDTGNVPDQEYAKGKKILKWVVIAAAAVAIIAVTIYLYPKLKTILKKAKTLK